MTNQAASRSVRSVLAELLEDPEERCRFRELQQRRNVLARLRSIRLAREMSQKDVAEKMGTSQSAVSELENEQSDPHMSTLQRYARATGHVFMFDVCPQGDEPPGWVAHLGAPTTGSSWKEPEPAEGRDGTGSARYKILMLASE